MRSGPSRSSPSTPRTPRSPPAPPVRWRTGGVSNPSCRRPSGRSWRPCWPPPSCLGTCGRSSRRPFRTKVGGRWSGAYLETTPGRAVSKMMVAKRLSSLCEHFDVQAVAYDRWRIEDFNAMAADEGVTLPAMHPFGQGYKDMSPAIERFETMLLNGQLAHANHPVMNWCAGNAVTVTDDAGNRKMSKERANGRIDLVVAAVMAAGCSARADAEQSVYEAHDVRML